MMTVWPRRLTLVVAPACGESFASWVDRMALQNGCPPWTMVEALGLDVHASSDVRSLAYGIVATPKMCRAIEAATGVSAEIVRGMHLEVFDGSAVDLEERLELAAARPVIWPEEILADHAKVNLSDALREACLDLGINLGLARKANPTDKANVERAFGVISEDFAKHVAGYKGSDTSSRGRLVEHAARWSLEDLEEFFAEYVVAVYQRRVHSGLIVPGFPELEMSPNQAYSLMVARYGYIVCPPSSHHYCKRLPIEYRVIRPEGVQRDYLIYDDPILGNYRRAISPVPGKGRKWPIRYHPGDPSRVFIFLEGAWHVLFWTHLPDPAIPFTWRMVEQARKLLHEGGLREPSQQDIADALVDLQRRMDAPESATARTRRELLRAREDARAIKRDQARAQIREQEESPPALTLVPPAEEKEPVDAVVMDLSELEEFEIWNPGAPQGPEGA